MLLLGKPVAAFSPSSWHHHHHHHHLSLHTTPRRKLHNDGYFSQPIRLPFGCLSMSTSDSSSTVEQQGGGSKSVLDGVSQFEAWFQTLDKATCQTSIVHSAFGTLRGLGWKEEMSSSSSSLPLKQEELKTKKQTVLSVPRYVVLSSSKANKGDDDLDWDVELALKLWDECCKGIDSQVYGYCSLLMRGQQAVVEDDKDTPPLSTAPNALRHWTETQLNLLDKSSSGRRLLNLYQTQQTQWKTKYQQQVSSSPNKISWNQFQWVMEVVHSRAFTGQFGLETRSTFLSVLAPLAAFCGVFYYTRDNPNIENGPLLALGGLALASLIPNLLNTFTSSSSSNEVVLLPLIDSANHLQSADSEIDYDPLQGSFSLTIGPKCLVKETNDTEGKTQLYISYGPKKDTELLLNYGFLPHVNTQDGEDEAARDLQRRRLAQAFMERNK